MYHTYKNGVKTELPGYEEQREKQINMLAEQERHRSLSSDEITNLFIRQNIQTLAVDDATAVRMRDYYPAFEECIGKMVAAGFKFTYEGELYRTRQEKTNIEKHYAPGPGMESLYEWIPEQYAGDEYDPIPYKGNVELMPGLYYTENGTLYRCTRGTEAPVYSPMREMVGVYVEEVTA